MTEKILAPAIRLACDLKVALHLALIFISTAAQAGSISGVINGRLTRANSPYLVTGDLRVAAGDSLLIEPGVELRFGAISSFIVEGLLIAEGTEQDSIFFTVNTASPLPGYWNGIFLYRAPARPIRRLVVSYAATGVTCDGGAPILELCRIRNNLNGVDFLNGSTAQVCYSHFLQNENAAIRCINASPRIEANLITQNALTGFESAVVCNASNPTIQRNLVYGNGNSGIDCTNGAAARIYQNTLANNSFGITISDSDPVLRNNLITGSLTGISCENAEPEIGFNNVFGNSNGNYLNCPAGVGEFVTVNFNNDTSDVFFNFSRDPLYVDAAAGDFRIAQGSHSIDAGDPDNPAGISFSGPRPDIGFFEVVDGVVSVSRRQDAQPSSHRLEQNYPNPFNPGTTIVYEIAGSREVPVRLTIHNSVGQTVRKLITARQAPGRHQIFWPGEDDHARPVASGIYFSRLEINGAVRTRAMILAR